MNNISIQPAKPEDAALLTQIALSAKRYWGYPEHWMEIWIPQLTFTSEYFEEHESWVAVDRDKLTGFYTLQNNDGNAWIENLWILPEYTGKGVGKMLFIHATEQARQHGYKRMQLEADPNAVGFYEKMGMYQIGERQSEVAGHPRSLPLMEMTL